MPFNTSVVLASLTLGIVLPAPCSRADESPELPPAAHQSGVTYAADISPMFERSCIDCHGAEKQKAKLRLDTLEFTLQGAGDEKVVVPGESAKSELVLAVAHATKDEDKWMPKGRNAKKLTADEIGLIRAWIDQGAK